MKKPTRLIRVEGGVAYVPLTKGYEAVIDLADVQLLENRSWRAGVCGQGSIVYAVTWDRIASGKRKLIFMHRIVANTPDGLETDHINGDGLDNRRSNLRIATASQNMHNKGIQSNNSSGFKGVVWNKACIKWQAQIKIGGNRKYLGIFDTAEEAYAAYCKANVCLHGEFGRVA